MTTDNNLNVLIGHRIKYIRKKSKKTLKQLSDESDLSVGYLSNLERGVNSPTIDQIQKICSILKVNITNILSDEQVQNHMLVRAKERKLFYNEESGLVKYELLTEGVNDLEGICITMEEGVNYEKTSWGHDYDEIGVVIKGKMCLEVLDTEHILEEGDSLYIKKNTLHSFRNGGAGECVSYWFYMK